LGRGVPGAAEILSSYQRRAYGAKTENYYRSHQAFVVLGLVRNTRLIGVYLELSDVTLLLRRSTRYQAIGDEHS
jgi:hypothetical protein